MLTLVTLEEMTEKNRKNGYWGRRKPREVPKEPHYRFIKRAAWREKRAATVKISTSEGDNNIRR